MNYLQETMNKYLLGKKLQIVLVNVICVHVNLLRFVKILFSHFIIMSFNVTISF
jgi:hypothetical protein